MADGTPRYGEQPLAQTVAAAGALRRLTGLLLSLEHEHPTVDAMLAQFVDWERELTAAAPPDLTPRIGDGGEEQRVYLDHAFDIGAYNPCFPEYTFDHLDDETASGRVTFPLVYEGPPGLVNGGFLARLLRLHHPTPELRCRADRQDALAHGDLPPAHADPHRTSLRHRTRRRRWQGHVDGAAAAGRRGALHR